MNVFFEAGGAILDILTEAVANAPNTSAIAKEVYPVVHAALAKQGGVNKYKGCVNRYIESHPAVFNGIPNNRLYYGTTETEDFYKSLGITPEQILAGLQHTFYWKMNYSPISAKDPLTVAALMVVRHFVMANDMKNAELASIYLAFTGKMYPSAHFNSFRFLPDDCDAVMNYVANNEISKKFDLRQEKTIFGVVKKLSVTWLKAYVPRIKKCTDDDVGYIIKQLQGRIKSFIKNFATLYYRAYEDKDYFNFESDSYTEDDFRLSATDSSKAGRYVETAMTYITSHAVDYKLCSMCADHLVKKDEIKEIMETVLSNPDNLPLVRELVSNLVSDYMRNSDTKDVRDLDFVSYNITAKPNAKDPHIVRIKAIVYQFLNENSASYRKRKVRPETDNSYYRAFVSYVVLVINKANK